MRRIQNYYHSLAEFLNKGVWLDPPESDRLRVLFYQVVRILLLTLRGLQNQVILLRAAALSISTLLAVGPLLALAFIVLKGLDVHTRLEHVLIHYLTAGQEDLSQRIIEYISNTDFAALGAIGTAVLVYAVIMMLNNVEQTLNKIWGITRNRNIFRKVTNYTTVLIFGPLLIAVSTAMLASFSSTTVVQVLTQYGLFERFFVLFKIIIPHAGLWIGLTAIYVLLPNTRVRFLPALIAAIICGIVWEAAFGVYTEFNIGLTRYNKIYGTFAVLPVFIIWLYISWIIVLLGAQLAYAIQNVKTHQQDLKADDYGYDQIEQMAVAVMVMICERFNRGLPPMTAEQMSNTLSIPLRLIGDITSRLYKGGLLVEIYGDETLYHPGRNPSQISVLDVFMAMRRSKETVWRVGEKAYARIFSELMETSRSLEVDHLGAISMTTLMERSASVAAS
jgi:membrane protein